MEENFNQDTIAISHKIVKSKLEHWLLIWGKVLLNIDFLIILFIMFFIFVRPLPGFLFIIALVLYLLSLPVAIILCILSSRALSECAKVAVPIVYYRNSMLAKCSLIAGIIVFLPIILFLSAILIMGWVFIFVFLLPVGNFLLFILPALVECLLLTISHSVYSKKLKEFEQQVQMAGNDLGDYGSVS